MIYFIEAVLPLICLVEETLVFTCADTAKVKHITIKQE